MATKTPTPTKAPPGRSGGRKPEPPLVVKARAAVNAAATDFETARQAFADAGHTLQITAGTSKEWDKVNRAFSAAKDAYGGASRKLSAAQQALTDAQAVAK